MMKPQRLFLGFRHKQKSSLFLKICMNFFWICRTKQYSEARRYRVKLSFIAYWMKLYWVSIKRRFGLKTHLFAKALKWTWTRGSVNKNIFFYGSFLHLNKYTLFLSLSCFFFSFSSYLSIRLAFGWLFDFPWHKELFSNIFLTLIYYDDKVDQILYVRENGKIMVSALHTYVICIARNRHQWRQQQHYCYLYTMYDKSGSNLEFCGGSIHVHPNPQWVYYLWQRYVCYLSI